MSFPKLVIVFLTPQSSSKRVASYPELVINASYALLLLNAYVALSRSWHVFILKHFYKCGLVMMPKGRGRNGLPIRREQIEKGWGRLLVQTRKCVLDNQWIIFRLGISKLEPCSSLYGTSFQLIWNIIPTYLESCSILAIPSRKVNKALYGA